MPDAKKSASELRREAHRLSGERPGYTHGATAPDEHDVQACLTCAIETIADRLEEAERTSWKLTQWLAACQILGQGEEPNVDHEAESPVVAAVRRLKERVEKAERAVEETHAEMDRKVNLLLRDRIKAECDRDSFKAPTTRRLCMLRQRANHSSHSQSPSSAPPPARSLRSGGMSQDVIVTCAVT